MTATERSLSRLLARSFLFWQAAVTALLAGGYVAYVELLTDDPSTRVFEGGAAFMMLVLAVGAGAAVLLEQWLASRGGPSWIRRVLTALAVGLLASTLGLVVVIF